MDWERDFEHCSFANAKWWSRAQNWQCWHSVDILYLRRKFKTYGPKVHRFAYSLVHPAQEVGYNWVQGWSRPTDPTGDFFPIYYWWMGWQGSPIPFVCGTTLRHQRKRWNFTQGGGPGQWNAVESTKITTAACLEMFWMLQGSFSLNAGVSGVSHFFGIRSFWMGCNHKPSV